jgi:hypothetical protein
MYDVVVQAGRSSGAAQPAPDQHQVAKAGAPEATAPASALGQGPAAEGTPTADEQPAGTVFTYPEAMPLESVVQNQEN